MKYILLDFDGVLNTQDYQERLHDEGEPQWDEFGHVFDPNAVENLKTVLDAVPDALLVVNSSWKLEGFSRMKELWKVRGLPGNLYGMTPNYAPDLSGICLDADDSIRMLCGKGYEVKAWIEMNAREGCLYVIIDDDPWFLPEQKSHLLRTDPHVGITRENAIQAIEMLNGGAPIG